MNITDDKIKKVIGKILRETIEGKLEWQILKNTSQIGKNIDGNANLIGNVYYTIADNKPLRIYMYNSIYYIDIDEHTLITRCQLEFFDSYTNSPLWAFPPSSSVSDLYNEICFKISGAEDFIKSYLE